MRFLKFDVVMPCFNESAILEKNALKLLKTLREQFGNQFALTIADNASTDSTFKIARELKEKFKEIRVVRVKRKGRGFALRKAWLSSPCSFLAYVDADLSYNPKALREMFHLLEENDLVNCSRHLKKSQVKRFAFRAFLSCFYISLIKLLFKTQLTDFQAGMKALGKDFAKKILPSVKDNGFFFDTELLLRAENSGAKITELPCSYVDLRKSTVKVFSTSLGYFLKLLRLRIELK